MLFSCCVWVAELTGDKRKQTQAGAELLLTVFLVFVWFVSVKTKGVYVIFCGFIHNRQTTLLGGGIDLLIKKKEIMRQNSICGFSQNLTGRTESSCSTSNDITQYH